MFNLVPSDQAGNWKAQISDDNLCIEWPKGPGETWTEPPWRQLYMEQYDREFRQAEADYRLFMTTSRLRLEK